MTKLFDARFGRRALLERSLTAGTAAVAFSAAGLTPGRALAADPVVETSHGKLRGAVIDGVQTFKGIAYGDTTAGDGRFLAPRKPKSWSGTRDALNLGPMSPQIPGDYSSPDLQVYYPVPNPPETMGEDCLVLNVWTPGADRNAKRPVMVWLHGGGYASGSDGPYDLLQLAKFGNVVTVGINHRLNIFGYLYLGELGGDKYADSGNAGMLDIVAALEWVRDNAAAFGGDPGNVTIFGQSGGGGKVSTLMAMPAAKGLFHRAIAQSGTALKGLSKDAASKSAEAIMRAMELKPNQVDALQAAPMHRLLAAMKAAQAKGGLRLAPVVDGKALPRDPFDPDAPALTADVPMIIGSNKTETAVLIGEYAPPKDIDVFALDDTSLPGAVKRYARVDDANAAKLIALYRKKNPSASPSRIFFLITTDRGTRMSAVTQAERKAALGKAPAYMYVLNWETPILGGKLGAPHNLEIPFVFHDVDNKIDANTGEGKERYKLQDEMAGAWVAFARTGNPNGPGLPRWAPYTAAKRTTMIFDTTSKAVDDPNAEEIAALKALPQNPG